MNPRALGWDNHRKFSKVSVMEQTPDGEIRVVERARLEHDDGDAMRHGCRVWTRRYAGGPGGHLRLAVGGRSAGGAGPSRPSGPSAGDPGPGQARSQDRPLRQRSAGKVSTSRHLAGELPCAAGSPPDRGNGPATAWRCRRCGRAVKNRIQAVLHRHGILHDFSDLFGKAGRRFLEESGSARRFAAGPARMSGIARRADGVDRAKSSNGWSRTWKRTRSCGC